MGNNLSLEEIKDSLEIRWREYNNKHVLVIFLAFFVISLLIPILGSINNIKSLGINFLNWFCCMIIFGIVILIFNRNNYVKIKYILKNYKNFSIHEVILDNYCTSYSHKGSLYYKVRIDYDGISKIIKTNPYFSSSTTSKFSFRNYHNKKVVGLYDSRFEKFYIVRKINK